MKPTDGYILGGLLLFGALEKGGYASKGFRIRLPDLSGADIQTLNTLEDELRVLLAAINDDARIQMQWTVDSDYKRELLGFYERTKQLADNPWSKRQRNERFTRYWRMMEQRMLRRQRLHIFISTKIDSSGAPPKSKDATRFYDYLLASAQEQFRSYEELLSQIFGGMGGTVDALGDEGHFEEYYRFYNPSVVDQFDFDMDARFDSTSGILENCWNNAAAPLEKPDYGFYLDGYYHGVVVLKTVPKATYAGMMDQLTGLDMLDYSITVNIRPLDVMKEIEKEESQFEKLQRATESSPKLRMVSAMQKKGAKIARLMSNKVIPYEAQMILRAWDPDKAGLRAKLAALRSAIGKLNGAKHFDPALPTSTRNFFLASTPGYPWSSYNDYSHYIEDMNLANLLPMGATPSADLEDAEAIYDGEARNLIGIKTFSGTPGNESPRHGIMFGMSGAGKSVTTIDLLTQTEPYYDFTVIIEEGLSYGTYTQTVEKGANPIIIQPNGSLTFNYLDTGNLPLTAAHLQSAAALVLLMVGTHSDGDVNKRRLALISNAIRQLYKDIYEGWSQANPSACRDIARYGLTLRWWMANRMPAGASSVEAFLEIREKAMSNDAEVAEILLGWNEEQISSYLQNPSTADEAQQLALAWIPPEGMPTHSMLHEFVYLEGHGRTGGELGDLAPLLEPWCASGNYGPILDGISNVRLDGKIAHFELGFIPEAAEDLRSIASFLITNQARNEIMGRPRNQRKRVILEELSAFLAIPDGERITREFYERMRKYNCWVFSIVQQYGRFSDSPVRSSVLGNSRMSIMLRQRDRKDLDEIGETFPLPEPTKQAIMNFPQPGQKRAGPPFSGFVYYAADEARPSIAPARNYASKEMLYASSSSGAVFEQRAKDLRQYESVVDGIIQHATDPPGEAGGNPRRESSR